MRLAFLLLLPSLALAHPSDRRGHVHEQVDNHADQANDRVDAIRLSAYIDDWNTAVDAGNKGLERAADAQLERWIRQEIREGRRDVAEAEREVRGSQRERNSERRQLTADVLRGRPAAASDNLGDLGDDRRDLRDDRADASEARTDQAATLAIAERLSEMQPAFAAGTATTGLYAEKRGLLRDLQRLARAERAEGREEIREDRQERREDRRDVR